MATAQMVSRPLAPICGEFIKSNGQLGPVGKQLKNYMLRKPYKEAFLDRQSLVEFCPGYSGLSKRDKVQAWVWFWMVLSNEESSCNPNAVHPTHAKINGEWIRINPKDGYGLFAAELYGGDRKWRGPECQGDMKSLKVQLKCAVQTMYQTQLQDKKGVHHPYSYWGPVRRSVAQIVPNMNQFAPCYRNSNTNIDARRSKPIADKKS